MLVKEKYENTLHPSLKKIETRLITGKVGVYDEAARGSVFLSNIMKFDLGEKRMAWETGSTTNTFPWLSQVPIN